MPPTTGPYASPTTTGATTGPYAGPPAGGPLGDPGTPMPYPPPADVVAAGYPMLSPSWAPVPRRIPLRELAARECRWAAATCRRTADDLDRAAVTFTAARRIVGAAVATARSRLLELDLRGTVGDVLCAVADMAADLVCTPLDIATGIGDELSHRWLVRHATPRGVDPYESHRHCPCRRQFCGSYRWSPAGLAEFGDPRDPAFDG